MVQVFTVICQMGKTFSLVFSTVWWAFVSGRSSSVDVCSRMDSPQSDSLWRAFWEQSACQHNTRDNSENQHKDRRQSRKKENAKQEIVERLETAEWERKMKRFVFRRKSLCCLSSSVAIYHVHGLSVAMARQNGQTDEIYTWMSHDLSFDQLEREMHF